MTADSPVGEVMQTALFCPECDHYYWFPDERELEEGDECPHCFGADLEVYDGE